MTTVIDMLIEKILEAEMHKEACERRSNFELQRIIELDEEISKLRVAVDILKQEEK